jgi:hypothetical protein
MQQWYRNDFKLQCNDLEMCYILLNLYSKQYQKNIFGIKLINKTPAMIHFNTNRFIVNNSNVAFKMLCLRKRRILLYIHYTNAMPP